MQGNPITDREAYPAAWITLAALVGAFLIWRFALGEPTVSRCWVWEHWQLYCPGCGGSRALAALARGLPRQYMHNKENAVTMRLSAH